MTCRQSRGAMAASRVMCAIVIYCSYSKPHFLR